jgi:O-antigen ligase
MISKLKHYYTIVMLSNNDLLLLSMIPIPFMIITSSYRLTFKRIFSDPLWGVQLILAILLTVLTVWFYKVKDANGEDQKNIRINIRKSLLSAWISFMIALCSEFHLLLAPFWIVFVSTLLYQEDE